MAGSLVDNARMSQNDKRTRAGVFRQYQRQCCTSILQDGLSSEAIFSGSEAAIKSLTEFSSDYLSGCLGVTHQTE